MIGSLMQAGKHTLGSLHTALNYLIMMIQTGHTQWSGTDFPGVFLCLLRWMSQELHFLALPVVCRHISRRPLTRIPSIAKGTRRVPSTASLPNISPTLIQMNVSAGPNRAQAVFMLILASSLINRRAQAVNHFTSVSVF